MRHSFTLELVDSKNPLILHDLSVLELQYPNKKFAQCGGGEWGNPMPISCRYKPEAKMVIFVHEGFVTDDEFLSFYRTFFEDPKFEAYGNYLVDLRLADSTSRKPEALLHLAAFLKQNYEDHSMELNIAVVAPQDLSFDLARAYEVYSCALPWHFQVFNNLAPALDWLGVTEESPRS